MGPKSHPKSSTKRQSVADTVGQGQQGDWATKARCSDPNQ